MPANKHRRQAVRRALEEVKRGADPEDLDELYEGYCEDLRPDEPGDGRIVRKPIMDDE